MQTNLKGFGKAAFKIGLGWSLGLLLGNLIPHLIYNVLREGLIMDNFKNPEEYYQNLKERVLNKSEKEVNKAVTSKQKNKIGF